MTNASGPTGGKIVLKTKKLNKRTKAEEWVVDPNGPAPRSVAIIHCVGSRDANYNAYCSRVCCMYSLKFAHLVREKLPDAACHEFYIDMRAFGKGYEEFMERIKAEGTHVVRGRTAQVCEVDGQHGRARRGHPARPPRRVPGRPRHSGRGRRAGDGYARSWRRRSVSRATATAGSPSSTTTAGPRRPSGAASSWPACARVPRTSPTRWPRPRP